MEGFKLINHTADTGIEVAGHTLEELFVNSARGLYCILLGEKVESRLKKKLPQKSNISLDAPDIETLIVEWLNEILFFAVNKNKYFDKIELKISGNALKASLAGGIFEGGFRHEVKSTTYHDLKIEKTKKGYRTKIIFDI